MMIRLSGSSLVRILYENSRLVPRRRILDIFTSVIQLLSILRRMFAKPSNAINLLTNYRNQSIGRSQPFLVDLATAAIRFLLVHLSDEGNLRILKFHGIAVSA